MDLKELLGDELYNKVQEKLGDKKVMIDDDNFVPLSTMKERLSKKDEEITTLKESLGERDNQLEDFKSKVNNAEELKQALEQAEAENKAKIEEYEKKIEKMSFESGLKEIIMNKYKAKNYKAVKANLDLDNISKDGSNYIGLDEQMNKLVKTDDYLFNSKKLVGNDTNPSKDTSDELVNNPFDVKTRNLSEQAKLIRTEPEKAKILIKKAGFKPEQYNL